MPAVNFQILSDLHLETHPSYEDFTFTQTAPYLALLGDIGHVANPQLFTFLNTQLTRYTLVFLLLGNHEPYHMSYRTARSKMRNLASRKSNFIFLDQTRYDLTCDLTILGCTLFSHISPQQELDVETRLVDFRDILKWSVEEHNAAHEADVAWLNAQVEKIGREEPMRRVVVFTHYCPSLDEKYINPRHNGSTVLTGFATDLSREECWRSGAVVAWGFGHTHFNCSFTTDDGKQVVVNQKGYYLLPVKTFSPAKVFTV